MTSAIFEHYRCPEKFFRTRLTAPLAGNSSFFRFGDDLLCHGRTASVADPDRSNAQPDLLAHIGYKERRLLLPFDPSEVIDSLRFETYAGPGNGGTSSLTKQLYYSIRPIVPTFARRILQRIYLSDWNRIPFPGWPVDTTVERLAEKLLFLYLRESNLEEIPFIWFWPDGAESAAIITHDVETKEGRNYCNRLMEIDESFGIRSSFQIVPEGRYTVSPGFLNEIRSRGHDVNIQDLNHDGNLFRDRDAFESRSRLINAYGREYRAKGFRSAVLYRNITWYDHLDFEFDMSVPNTGRLEAQRGGCCTVFPYFIGRILELPVTTTQDYSLFHVLKQYSIELWKAQADEIAANHGLASFIIHPDYVLEARAASTYVSLLTFLQERRAGGKLWIPTADELNIWWRQRNDSFLSFGSTGWRIEGPVQSRGRIAYARIAGDRIEYTVDG